jgi:hypothetical protein
MPPRSLLMPPLPLYGQMVGYTSCRVLFLFTRWAGVGPAKAENPMQSGREGDRHRHDQKRRAGLVPVGLSFDVAIEPQV